MKNALKGVSPESIESVREQMEENTSLTAALADAVSGDTGSALDELALMDEFNALSTLPDFPDTSNLPPLPATTSPLASSAAIPDAVRDAAARSISQARLQRIAVQEQSRAVVAAASGSALPQ